MKKLLIACFAALCLVAFTVPAMAADWNFYGSSRIATFWGTQSKEASATGFDDSDLQWDQQGNSRIGARVKAGDVAGRFEYGTGVNRRLLYGTWNFGGGELLVGQTYTPVNLFYSNQVYGSDNDLLNVGGVYNGRHPMIRLSVAGLKIALVQPVVNVGNIPAAAPAGFEIGPAGTIVATDAVMGYSDTDTSIPKLEASYGLNVGPASIALCGGYNTFKLVDASDNDTSLNSWVVGIGGKINFGPAYIGGDIFTGKNLGNYGLYIAGDQFARVDENGDIQDNKGTGALIVAGFKVNDMFSLEAGYGYVQGDPDFGTLEKDKTNAYYLQATINLAKGVFITPEFGKFDYQEDSSNVDEGDFTYFGAKWQINF